MRKIYLFLAAALVSMSSFGAGEVTPRYLEPEGTFYSGYNNKGVLLYPYMYMPAAEQYTFTSLAGAGDWKMGEQTATNVETFSPNYAFCSKNGEIPSLTIGDSTYQYGKLETSGKKVYVSSDSYSFLTNAKIDASGTSVTSIFGLKSNEAQKFRIYFYNKPGQVMSIKSFSIPVTTNSSKDNVNVMFPEGASLDVCVYDATYTRNATDGKYTKSKGSKTLIPTATLTKENFTPYSDTKTYYGAINWVFEEPILITGPFVLELSNYSSMGTCYIRGDKSTGSNTQLVKSTGTLSSYASNVAVGVEAIFISILKADEKQTVELPSIGGTAEAFAFYSSKNITADDITLPDWASVDAITYEGDEYAASKKIYITLKADANETGAKRTGEIVINNQGMKLNVVVSQEAASSPTNLNNVKAQDGQRYNILGQPVKETYRGIVIMNGQTFIQ